MVAEKVVTVTLPSGTKVSCREGLAARLASKQPEPKKSPAPRRRTGPTSDDE